MTGFHLCMRALPVIPHPDSAGTQPWVQYHFNHFELRAFEFNSKICGWSAALWHLQKLCRDIPAPCWMFKNVSELLNKVCVWSLKQTIHFPDCRGPLDRFTSQQCHEESTFLVIRLTIIFLVLKKISTRRKNPCSAVPSNLSGKAKLTFLGIAGGSDWLYLRKIVVSSSQITQQFLVSLKNIDLVSERRLQIKNFHWIHWWQSIM